MSLGTSLPAEGYPAAEPLGVDRLIRQIEGAEPHRFSRPKRLLC